MSRSASLPAVLSNAALNRVRPGSQSSVYPNARTPSASAISSMVAIPVDKNGIAPKPRDREEQWRIGQVARTHLDPLQPQSLDQQPKALEIEWRRQEFDPARAAMREQPVMRCVVQLKRLQHVELAFDHTGIP